MLKIGLTGNIGSGKSTVARIFDVLEVKIYHADVESKKFLANPEVKNQISKAFGESIVNADSTIDKTALSKVVFANPIALQLLNSILHPLVMEDFRKFCGLHIEEPYIINEAAIIFESGYRAQFDRIIHVSCPEEIAITRVMTRDKVLKDEVLKRMNFQMKDQEKAALSDFIILNDGSTLVIPQILRIHNQLLQSSA